MDRYVVKEVKEDLEQIWCKIQNDGCSSDQLFKAVKDKKQIDDFQPPTGERDYKKNN